MSDCLFCKILNQEIPSQMVFENDSVYGFKDISPMAKEHYLFIHKTHTSDINDMSHKEAESIIDVFNAIRNFTEDDTELSKNGFRVVTNLGQDGGQTVFHTHFHVLGGEKLRGFGA